MEIECWYIAQNKYLFDCSLSLKLCNYMRYYNYKHFINNAKYQDIKLQKSWKKLQKMICLSHRFIPKRFEAPLRTLYYCKGFTTNLVRLESHPRLGFDPLYSQASPVQDIAWPMFLYTVPGDIFFKFNNINDRRGLILTQFN